MAWLRLDLEPMPEGVAMRRRETALIVCLFLYGGDSVIGKGREGVKIKTAVD